MLILKDEGKARQKEETEEEDRMPKKRYVGLDLFRVLLAAGVCAFHIKIHLKCDYGFLMGGVGAMGAVFMTAFFMLSGFTLYLNYSESRLCEWKETRRFYVKRAIGILPMYYIAALLYIVFLRPQSPTRELLLLPAELTGIQSVFSSLFDLSHNGGTWFISCLLLAYLIYPFLQEIIRQLTMSGRIELLLFSSFLLLYAPLVVHVFHTASIYSNPFFRILEFQIGICLAALFLEGRGKLPAVRIASQYWLLALEVILFILILDLLVWKKVYVGNYMLYNWVALPFFCLFLFGCAGIESPRLMRSQALRSLSGITYVFFLAQLYSNWLCKKIISHLGICSNAGKIALGWGVCIALALCLRGIELFVKKALRRAFPRI